MNLRHWQIGAAMICIPRKNSCRTALAVLALSVLSSGPVPAQQQVWTSERYENPSFSPTRESILIEATIPPRNSEIFLSRADGSDLRNLTRHPAEDIGARWSPDGRAILFKSDRDGDYGLFRMNPDGSGVTKIASRASMFGQFGWSPDGRSIVYGSREGVMVAAADGSAEPRVVVAAGADPIWSPDGRWILYEKGGPGQREVHVVALDGGVDRKITDGWAITWSPDSSAIFYLSHTSRVHPNLAHLYRINSDGSGRRQVLHDVLAGANPNDPTRLWSPDGSKLALRIGDVGGLRPREGVVVVDRDAGIVRDLRRHEPFACGETLTWRDDKTIALSKLHLSLEVKSRMAKDPGGIYLLDVESGRERQIVRNKEILIDSLKPPW